MNLTAIERAENFLQNAEKTGLLAQTKLKAEEKDDVRRRRRADQLLEVMAARQAELVAPAEAVRVAGVKLNQAAATYRIASFEYQQADDALFLAGMACDNREGRLRRELREIAPDCVRETEFKIHALRMAMIRAIAERSWVGRNPGGGIDLHHETNLAEVTPVTKYLESAEAEVAEFVYESATAVEISRKCELLLEECKTKAAPFLFPHVIAELFKPAA